MVDYAKIKVKAGDGGDGAVSFYIHKGRPYGPPDGGDGGKGGDVYLMSCFDKSTLVDFNFQKLFKAQSGDNGGKNNKRGRSGKDIYIKIPVGTIVRDLSTNQVFDFDQKDKIVQIANSGLGGHGNALFKSMRVDKKSEEYWRAVRTAERGHKGEEKELILELKLLADIGLIGLPNAGKSTLLSVLTLSKPKIAPYPFTTLEPFLGVMNLEKSLVLADIPGLIEGASKGKGLGIQFLKHIERTKILIHLISVEVESKIDSFNKINTEIQAFSEKLKSKPQIVVLSKIDILSKEEIDKIVKEFKHIRVKIIPISALTGKGLENLKKEIFRKIGKG